MIIKRKIMFSVMGILAYTGITTSQTQASASSSHETKAPAHATAGAATHHATTATHKTILVVDDNSMNRKLNQRIINAGG
ncbi:MAG: hypothetical protein H0U27_09075, partial [Nitrosopumilus sp.]|nr:hypothetical protein [Nitrosopumilus sp.]